MKSREKIKASFWWNSLFDTFDKVCREFITRGQAAELAEKGHECGHLFEISIRSAGHYGIVDQGPESHKDAPFMPDDVPNVVQVRAHSLRQALLVAAALPFNDWFDDEED